MNPRVVQSRFCRLNRLAFCESITIFSAEAEKHVRSHNGENSPLSFIHSYASIRKEMTIQHGRV